MWFPELFSPSPSVPKGGWLTLTVRSLFRILILWLPVSATYTLCAFGCTAMPLDY